MKGMQQFMAKETDGTDVDKQNRKEDKSLAGSMRRSMQQWSRSIPAGALQANPVKPLFREIKLPKVFDELELQTQREGFSLLHLAL